MAEVCVKMVAYADLDIFDVFLVEEVRKQGYLCCDRKYFRDGKFLVCKGDLGHEEDHWAYGPQDSFHPWARA